jgi:hypothetical protein
VAHLLHAPEEGLKIRSVERRRWSSDLVGSAAAGLVLHGLGGIGKSMLAAEIAARASDLESERVTAVIRGEVSADRFLAELAAAVRRCPVASPRDAARTDALDAAARIDLPWEERLTRLREHVLGQVPVLIILDDFDDNLHSEASSAAEAGLLTVASRGAETGHAAAVGRAAEAGRVAVAGGAIEAGRAAAGRAAETGPATVADPALAGLLASWAGVPHLGRLLITCRSTFVLPGGAEQALGFRHLGPLSRTDVTELAAGLPALGSLGEAELDQAWRLTGGHPRNLEYLDALLSAEEVGFADVAGLLAGSNQPKPGQAGPGQLRSAEPATLAIGEAEAIAADAGDRLLGALWDRLSPGARHLLVGVSVYRQPVARSAALLPEDSGCRVNELFALTAQCARVSLMTVDHDRKPPLVHVHRWTADELHRQLAASGRGGELTAAHRRAAAYWRARVNDAPQDRPALLESRHHLREAGDLTPRIAVPVRPIMPPAQRQRRGLVRLGLAGAVTAGLIIAVVHLAGSAAPAHEATPRSHAVDAGDPSIAQAAAWVAQQVSQGTTIACSPAMCSALRGHGVAAGRLRMLSLSSTRLAAAGPPDANLLIETPAVRTQFGSSLVDTYAPGVMASFGAGTELIDVRAVAPGGAAAYRVAQAAAVMARAQSGRALAGNPQVTLSASARSDLIAGQVDTRLMITLATMAATEPVRVISFADAGPGASPGTPLRAARLTVGPTGQPGGLRTMLNFVRAQRPPYRPVYAALVGPATGRQVLIVEFAAPSPTGPL